MRVPTRSAGTRSGVNWMRLKLPRSVRASVLTVSVLARPGTPSTSKWPWARMATSTRSRKWSCPTTTFFTSYSTCSICRDTSVPPVCRSFIWIRRLCSERRHADCRRRIFNRDREADTDEYSLVARVQYGGHDADHLAIHGHQRAAGIAGVGGGVELDQVGQDL